MSLHLHPVSAAGRALHGLVHLHPRLPSGDWRPYVGIFGVLLGSIMGTLGSHLRIARGGGSATLNQAT